MLQIVPQRRNLPRLGGIGAAISLASVIGIPAYFRAGCGFRVVMLQIVPQGLTILLTT
jgi:hypothetical protein